MKNNPVPPWTRRQDLQEAAGAAPQSSENGENSALEAQLSHFEGLLSGDSVDLSRISNEIRSRPALEALTMRLVVALGLSAEESLRTVEEAVVMLGVTHLRAIVYVWFLVQQSLPLLPLPAKNSDDDRHSGAGNARFLSQFFPEAEPGPAALAACLLDENLLLDTVALARRCDVNILGSYLRAIFAIANRSPAQTGPLASSAFP